MDNPKAQGGNMFRYFLNKLSSIYAVTVYAVLVYIGVDYGLLDGTNFVLALGGLAGITGISAWRKDPNAPDQPEDRK